MGQLAVYRFKFFQRLISAVVGVNVEYLQDLANYWTAVFDATHAGRVDTWDYQWVFATMLQGGVAIAPRGNLARNIGFSPDATNTTDPNDAGANLPLEPLAFPLRHPASVTRDAIADRWEEQHLLSIRRSRISRLRGWIGAARRTVSGTFHLRQG